MKLDLTRPVQTLRGQSARIICTDLQSTHPVIALIKEGKLETICLYDLEGRWLSSSSESSLNLRNIPEEEVSLDALSPKELANRFEILRQQCYEIRDKLEKQGYALRSRWTAAGTGFANAGKLYEKWKEGVELQWFKVIPSSEEIL